MHARVSSCPEKAPAAQLELLRFTLQNVNTFFVTMPQQKVWLTQQEAVQCINACRCITETWF